MIKSLMLLTLRIRNFALIENAEMELGEGLNILSGETGSGKSILVQALEVMVGGRASADLIRRGEEEAEVAGLFSKDGGEMSLRRVITANGRSRAFLNERPVPVATLDEVGKGLIDLVRQHEHQVLLQPSRHLALLDQYAQYARYAGLPEEVAAYQEVFSRHRRALKEKEECTAREREAREREEFLRYQFNELNEISLKSGEEGQLTREREILRHAARLGEACFRAEEALDPVDPVDMTGTEGTSVLQALAIASKEVGVAVSIDPGLNAIVEQIEEGACRLQEAVKELRRYREGIEHDPERLQEVEERLAFLARMKKKYGASYDEMGRKRGEIESQLNLLDNFEAEIARKDREIGDLEKDLLHRAKTISAKRRSAATRLSLRVEQELPPLGMAGAKFSVDVRDRPLGEEGGEEVEFLIAPNVGEGLHPLSKVASGGEISRIFLAIKKSLDIREETTSIFDEIDIGIGGGVAEAVGRSLSHLAQKRQIVCVTHLPQVACYAERHFILNKTTDRGRTTTRIEPLESVRREEEIARMLAGVHVTEKAKDHAKDMILHARNSSRH